MKQKTNYLFLGFLAYGLYGAGLFDPTENWLSVEFIVFLVSPLVILILLMLFPSQRLEYEQNSLFSLRSQTPYEFLYFSFIASSLVIISWSFLSLSISNDAYFYATSGLTYAVNIAEILVARTEIFDNLTASRLLQLISAAIVGGLLASGVLFYKININFKLKVAAILCVLFVLRITVASLGGNQSPHPPFTGLLVFLASPLLGIGDLSAKLSFFIPYVFFAFILFRTFRQNASSISAALLTIALLSIPAILFIGSTVEQSLWGMLCFSMSLLLISQDRKINYFGIFFFIAILCFFRSSSILACIPIGLHCLFYDNKTLSFSKRFMRLIHAVTPIILFVPFLLSTLVQNTDTNIGRVSLDENIFSLVSLTEILRSSVNAFGLFPILMLAVLIILTIRHKLSLLGLFFFLILMVIFNLIDETGHPKYQIEYIAPMFIFYSILFLQTYSSRISRLIITTMATVLIMSNINLIWNYSDQCLVSTSPYNEENFEYKAKFGCNFLSQPPFQLNHAYHELRRINGYDSMYLPGVYYDGTLSQIMNGATVYEWRLIMKTLVSQKAIERMAGLDWRGSNAIHIDGNDEINFVIIADVLNATDLKEKLIARGWVVKNSHTNLPFKTNVSLLARNINL